MKAKSNRLSASLETKLEEAEFFQKATGMSERRSQKNKSRTFDLLKEDVNSKNGKMKCFSSLQRGLLQRQCLILKVLQKNTEKMQGAIGSNQRA